MTDEKKIKVFHIITKLELGGAQKVTLQTLKGLDQERFSLGLITSSEGMLLEEARSIEGIKLFELKTLVRAISPFKDILALLSVYRILKREKPQIIQTHSSKAGIVGRWAAYFARVPVIIHSVHGFSFNDFLPFLRKWFFILLEKLTSKATSFFFVDSQENIRVGRKRKLFRGDNYIQIKPGIELKQFAKAKIDKRRERERIGIPPEAAVVEMVACLKPQKAPLDFVQMAALVQKEVPSTHFILVGDGELRGQVERLIEELKLSETFLMLGWRRDIVQLIGLCDIMVLTSLWEGLPTVIPMAWAMKKPLVATRIDGNKEAVIEGENGFLVEPHDAAAMAEKVIYLLKNPGISHKMGERGAKGVEEFDIERMIRQQEEFYLKTAKI